MGEFRKIALKRLRHRFMVEAAKESWNDKDLCVRKIEHIAQLAFAKDRHQRIDDGADAEGGESDHRKFPPVRQLNRDHVAALDLQALQRRGGARNGVAKLGVTEAPPFRTVGAI